jgi:hypothetical protein
VPAQPSRQKARVGWGQRAALVVGVAVISTGFGLFLLPTARGQVSERGEPTKPKGLAPTASMPAESRSSDSRARARSPENTSSANTLDRADASVQDTGGDEDEPRFKPDPRTLEESLRRTQEREELRSRWNEEKRRDVPWSQSLTEGIIHGLVDNRVGEPASVDADCRETICRVILRSEGDSDREVMGVIRVARALHQETWLLAEDAEDGSYELELFLPRNGYRLSGGGGRIEPAE